ncbi:acyltransferase [Labilibacter sediminis]|nr:acyltransferase [Labilibacter sediminis]
MIFNNLTKRIRRFIVSHLGSDAKIKYLREQGVKIGKDCRIDSLLFSTEPYLIEIGNKVSIANGSALITHDASITCFRDEYPNSDLFGTIKIGDNVFVGLNSMILPNTVIGNNCIIGAGSVVRGKFPDNSIIMGNPAKKIMDVKIHKMLCKNNPGRLETRNLSDAEKKPIVMEHFNKMR